MPDQHDRIWILNVKADSDALVRAAATRLGVSRGAFVEESAVARARALMIGHQIVSLSRDEFDGFAAALDEAPIVVPRVGRPLRESAPNPRRLMRGLGFAVVPQLFPSQRLSSTPGDY